MGSLMLGLGGLCGAVFWLVMLVATSFSLTVVGIGLLAMLYVLNSSADQPRRSTRTGSAVPATAPGASFDRAEGRSKAGGL